MGRKWEIGMIRIIYQILRKVFWLQSIHLSCKTEISKMYQFWEREIWLVNQVWVVCTAKKITKSLINHIINLIIQTLKEVKVKYISSLKKTTILWIIRMFTGSIMETEDWIIQIFIQIWDQNNIYPARCLLKFTLSSLWNQIQLMIQFISKI